MKLLMENWRRFVNEEKEKSKEEEEFQPHMMYDPETGKGKKAETYEDHVEMDKKGWGHEKPDIKEGDEWHSDEHETLADKKFADSQASAQEGQGFQVGEFVNVVDGSLKGATGKVIEITTTTTGEEGFVIELYSDAKMKVFGKRGDEVIAVAGDLESGGTTDGMELYDIDEAKNEDGKEQGVDGKACWDGYKHAGSEDTDGDGKADKDKCVKNEEAELTERGSPLENNFQHAIMDFIVEQMNSMGLNPGDPMDRDRMKKQVMSIVGTAISALDLDEGAKVKDKYDDEVENKNEKSRKQGMAAYLKEESLAAFVDVVLDEAAAELEEGGKCTKATEKTTSTAKGKKYMKCIKNPDGEGYVRRHWGQKGARAAPKGSARNKSFNKRHDCKNAKAGSANKLSCDDW